MRKIKIKFVDFWSNYKPEERSICQLLSTKYELEFSDEPDYLFYGCFGHEHLSYNCVKIYIATECVEPDFNICDYAIGYSLLSYGDRYLYYPAAYEVGYRSSCELMLNKSEMTKEEYTNKEGFCSIVVSNGLNADKMRSLLIEEINKYKRVDSGGKYRNNVGGPVKDKIEFQSHYRFSIAAENTSFPGYVTEKIIESFASRTIPIYWGDPKACEIYNPEAFIDCTKFEKIDDIINEIKRIDENEEEYLKMVNACPVIDPTKWNYEERQKVLGDFLFYILDQDLLKAKRINVEAANRDYVSLLKDWRDAYKFSWQRLRKRINTVSRRRYWH